jgi:hypothetical protein
MGLLAKLFGCGGMAQRVLSQGGHVRANRMKQTLRPHPTFIQSKTDLSLQRARLSLMLEPYLGATSGQRVALPVLR